MTIEASDWKAVTKATLQGFCTLTLLPSGLRIKDVSLHSRDGRDWIGLPGKPQLDRDTGKQRIDAAGKPMYVNIIEFTSREASDRFQAAALEAIRKVMPAAGAVGAEEVPL